MKTRELVYRKGGKREVLARFTLISDTQVGLEVFVPEWHPLRGQLTRVLSGAPDRRKLGPGAGITYWDALPREFAGRIEDV